MKEDHVDLVASCWLHSGATTPFPGAHGHRNWSPWRIERRVKTLASEGYTGIGLFHDDLVHILEHEFAEEPTRRAGLHRLNRLLTDNGFDFVELEFLVEWPLPESDPRRQDELEIEKLLFDAADVLDANHIKIGNPNGYPRSVDELQTRYGSLCKRFGELDTAVGYELIPRDHNVETLEDALVFAGDTDNGGLFLDIFHLVKMGVPFEAIRKLTPDDIVGVEIVDGYLETGMDNFVESINLRKLPGEGEFPLEDFIDSVQSTGFSGPWGLEILSEEYRRLPMKNAYSRAYKAAMGYL